MPVEQLITRTATVQPSSFNADAHTVDVVFLANEAVERRDLEGPFTERIPVSSMDFSAAVGAPVLDSHRREGIRGVLGTVLSARVENGQGVATLQLTRAEDARPAVDRIREGIARAVSLGIDPHGAQWTRENGRRIVTYPAARLREISFVPLGADVGARVRSFEGDTMPEEVHEQIRSAATVVGLSREFTDGLIERNLDLTAARTAIIAELQRQQPVISPVTRTSVTADTPTLVERMADGLYARMNPSHVPTIGREYSHCSIPELARVWLRENNLSTTGSAADVITRSMYGLHTTSDFSGLLSESLNKALLTLRTAPSPIAVLFRRATVNDFRARHVLTISNGPALELVPEDAEIPRGTIGSAELASYRVQSYARIFGVSFATLVNDDLGALSDLSSLMLRGARSWFAGFLVDMIISNPPLEDGQPTFSTAHKNLSTTPAAPSEESITEGKLQMRLQVDGSGNPLDNAPKYILAPAALESTIDGLLATLYPPTSDEAETAARGLIPIIDPRLDARGQTKSWYLLSDPQVSPVFEFAELSGYRGPQIASRSGFDVLGTEIRCVWHLGSGAVSPYGGWKNPGL